LISSINVFWLVLSIWTFRQPQDVSTLCCSEGT
jgi:hypothetical protein